MTHEQILKKAIEKVERNGYKFWNVNPKHIKFIEGENIFQYAKSPYPYYAGVYETIFSHDFAKAFWGEKLICWNCLQDFPCIYGHGNSYEEWKYHLKQMVLEDDPISYLEIFL